jgi:hypothetical protein
MKVVQVTKFDNIEDVRISAFINGNESSQALSSEDQNNTINEALNILHAAKMLKSTIANNNLINNVVYAETSNLGKDGDGMKWFNACKRLGLIKDIQYKEIENNGMDGTEVLVMEGITIENKVYVKRTLKYLMALCKGLWIVNSYWLRDCLHHKKLVLPDDYEITGTEDDNIINAPKKARGRSKYKHMQLFSKYTFSVFEAKELEGERSSKLKKEDAITLIKYCGGNIYDESIESNDTNDNCNRSHIQISNQLKKPTKDDKQMMIPKSQINNSYSSGSNNSSKIEVVYTNTLLSINFLIDSICNQQIPSNFSPYELR